MILTADEYFSTILDCGFASVTVARDRRVFCPSLDWVREFGSWLVAHAKPYQAEKYDCDDFAEWGKVCATEALFQNVSITDAGHSFFIADVVIGSGCHLNGIPGPGVHATNACLGNDSILYLCEPQTGQVMRSADVRGVVLLNAWL